LIELSTYSVRIQYVFTTYSLRIQYVFISKEEGWKRGSKKEILGVFDRLIKFWRFFARIVRGFTGIMLIVITRVRGYRKEKKLILIIFVD